MIEVLYNNIISYFEKSTPKNYEFLKKINNQELIKKEILLNDDLKLAMPKVNENKEIILNRTYLIHLWSFMYSIFVIYENIQEKMMKEDFNWKINADSDLEKRAYKLLEYSLNLIEQYKEWDSLLPNPKVDYSKENEEIEYIKKANNLFKIGIVFTMYHEVGHLSSNHFNNIDKTTTNQEYIELEKEADEFALSLIINAENENEKIEKAIAILITLISSLFIGKRKSIIQNKHPNTDQRIFTLLQKLNFEDEPTNFYFWYLGSLSLYFYLKHIGENIKITRVEEDSRELFFHYLSIIDKITVKK
ncbi:phage exclusion protein Lit family protein [Aliarcobacter cryaerophilus]|uniref:phage exclusion protein Lit family protein n=1 Tax=Aliarcobacter cryaerophilus TaxID=28198 RepID=UPI000825EE31|nr:phage exclusion protein Lit family protein [Aliarcobacter cryaerophilus]